MIRRNKRKSRAKSFNPNHEYVANAVNDFLKKGGKITQLKAKEGNFSGFVDSSVSTAGADEYLNGDPG